MVLKLHGHPFSTCTQFVLTILHEKQVEFDFVHVRFSKAEQKSPEYVALQPFGQVPLLDDDGFLLYESRAIAEYIAAKYRGQGADLYPADGDIKALARLHQGLSIEQANFDNFTAKIAFEKIFKSFRGLGPNESIVSEATAILDEKLMAYESILSKQKYLTGDKISLGDLAHLPFATLIEGLGLGELFVKYPAFYRWLKDMQGRESWKKVAPFVVISQKDPNELL